MWQVLESRKCPWKWLSSKRVLDTLMAPRAPTLITPPICLSTWLADRAKLRGQLDSCSLGFCHTRVLLTN